MAILPESLKFIPPPNQYTFKVKFGGGLIFVFGFFLIACAFAKDLKILFPNWDTFGNLRVEILILIAFFSVFLVLAIGFIMNINSKIFEGVFLRKFEEKCFADNSAVSSELLDLAKSIVIQHPKLSQKQLSAKGLLEIIRAQTGADFGRNPKADMLTANGDLGASAGTTGMIMTFTVIFFAILNPNDLTWADRWQLPFIAGCYSLILIFGGIVYLRRSRRALINLYLRSAVYWLDNSSIEWKKKDTELRLSNSKVL